MQPSTNYETMKNRKRHEEIDQDKMPCDCCATETWNSDLLELREAKTAEIAAKPVITREETTERTLTLCEHCNEEAESDLDLAPDGDVLAPDVFEKFWQWSHLNAILSFIGSENQPNTVDDVRDFFDALTGYLVWHPETCFKDYVFNTGENEGKPIFDTRDAIELDHIMERCQIICTRDRKDIYELARTALKKTGQVMDEPEMQPVTSDNFPPRDPPKDFMQSAYELIDMARTLIPDDVNPTATRWHERVTDEILAPQARGSVPVVVIAGMTDKQIVKLIMAGKWLRNAHLTGSAAPITNKAEMIAWAVKEVNEVFAGQ